MAKYYLLLAGLLSWLVPGRMQAQKGPLTMYQQLAQSVGAPGVVLVQDSLFLDETEVANLHWLEYLHFLSRDSSAAFRRSQLPDTALLPSYVQAHYGTASKYIANYLREPGFRYFPVVGISQAQAQDFCRWRTAVVNQNLHSEAYLRKHPQLRSYDFRVVYRLPTVAEWELAAAGRLSPVEQPFGLVRPPVPGSQPYKALRRNSKQVADCLAGTTSALPVSPLFEMEFTVRENTYVGPTLQAFSCPLPPEYVKKNSQNGGAPVMDYIYVNPPNAYGLYNLIGNVAELTATPGVAKGGSFEQSIKDFTLRTNFPYVQPQAWLGFRCACTVYIGPKAAK